MLNRLRLLPTVMLVAAMLLGLKVVHMIGGLGGVTLVSQAEAQTKPEPAEEPAAPAADEADHGDGAPEAAQGAHEPEQPKAHNRPEREMSDAEKKAALEAQSAQLNQTGMSPAEIAVLGSLAARREEIDQKAKEFAQREQLLAAAEKRVEERIKELKAIEARINSQIAATDAANEERLKGVVQMYETMKPKEAARIFERLDMGVLIDVAKRMSPRKMAAVLAVMDPVAAQDLTVELATGDRLPDTGDETAQKAEAAKPALGIEAAPKGQAG